ncbi:hypothetical protein [Pseudomonas syringae]|uniref:hypothetical protein n=1 Tax=Pseudomonas syringae TaxID=317 RepID=UPI00200B5F9A|nr:hypothetical protein [Pseudomonas syringae]MCK9744140.1 hypothetical protein [Pseudomonas syringae pv. syringae]MCK9769616.1 hypothetical protein [Pseudomonas syringae pv. syringae]
MKKISWILLPVMTIVSVTSFALSPSYVTPEFNDKNSHLPMVYVCGVIGEKGGYDSRAVTTIALATPKMGISAKKSGQLMGDALTWWEANHERYDIAGMWEGSCKEPIKNIKRIYLNEAPQE